MKDRAYIAGVLHGDGYCTEKGFGVTAADKDFVTAFAEASYRIYGVKPTVGVDRTYWRFFKGNTSGKFSSAKFYNPVNDEEKAMWVRGLFDSEGNANLTDNVGARGYTHRRISIYSTEISTLHKAGKFLEDHGIEYRIRETKNSASHIGSLVVYELALRGQEDFERFNKFVGSSIARKRIAMCEIVSSYLSLAERDFIFIDARKRGGATNRTRTATQTLPAVLIGIKDLISAGVKPTQRNCRSIPGYNTIQTRYPQAELVQMAERL
jgi:hypothetical protein